MLLLAESYLRHPSNSWRSAAGTGLVIIGSSRDARRISSAARRWLSVRASSRSNDVVTRKPWFWLASPKYDLIHDAQRLGLRQRQSFAPGAPQVSSAASSATTGWHGTQVATPPKLASYPRASMLAWPTGRRGAASVFSEATDHVSMSEAPWSATLRSLVNSDMLT